MDVAIQINDPILVPGSNEYFLVRYRLLPNGAWIDLGQQSNAPFMITGVDLGLYELEVRFVNDDGIICPAVIRNFEVSEDPPPDTCTCFDFDEIYVTKLCSGVAVIHLDFGGVGQGACQYQVTYTGFNGSSPQTITYNQGLLPPVLDLTIPDSNSQIGPTVILKLICCNGDILECYNSQITDIRDQDCDCDIPSITDAWINYDPLTQEYRICINFTSGTSVLPPYTIGYEQLNTNPADTGSVNQSTPGYYEIIVDPEPFTGGLEYRVIVSNECGRDLRVVKMRSCGDLVQYNGGESFPTEFTIKIDPSIINHTLLFDANSIPDKVIVLINGVEVLNTGYVGNTSYQTQLDAALISLGEPPATITSATGALMYNYQNTVLAEYAIIRVYSPLDNVSWSLIPNCDIPTSPKSVTLIIDNTLGSNVQTVQVHGATGVPGTNINFSPYQQPGETDTYFNVPGWMGSPNAGVFLKPITSMSATYQAEVFINGLSVSLNTYSFSGTSTFHLPCAPSGIVNGDEVKIVISKL